MEIIFSEETPTEVMKEIGHLITDHGEEIKILSGDYDIDYDRYIKSEELGVLKGYTARLDDKVIGYASFFLSNHILYRTKLIATQNALYVAPKFRKYGIGKALLLYSEDALGENGVDAIMHHVPEVNDFSGLVKSIGYNKLETVYIKEI